MKAIVDRPHQVTIHSDPDKHSARTLQGLREQSESTVRKVSCGHPRATSCLFGASTAAAIDRRLQRAKLVLFELGKASEPAFADLRLDFAAPLQLRLAFELA